MVIVFAASDSNETTMLTTATGGVVTVSYLSLFSLLLVTSIVIVCIPFR